MIGSTDPNRATSGDLKQETDHERLVLAFPVAGETIETDKIPCSGKIERTI